MATFHALLAMKGPVFHRLGIGKKIGNFLPLKDCMTSFPA